MRWPEQKQIISEMKQLIQGGHLENEMVGTEANHFRDETAYLRTKAPAEGNNSV